MHTLYNIAILSLHFFYRIAAIFHPKARKWVRGRIGWDEALMEELFNWPENRPRLWIHCASLGEFEQGRPLIERIREQHPTHLILLSFFSPSGYDMRRHFDDVHHVAYLPMDRPVSVRLFLDIVRPDLVVFVKYEFWFNFLLEIQRRNIPLILVSALFRKEQVFFRSYGRWFQNILAGFDKIFTQNESSKSLLRDIGIPALVAGDTRIDRVLASVRQEKDFPEIAEFCENAPVLVVGSSWSPDEALIREWWQSFGRLRGWKMIIAPHDISENHLQQIENRFAVDDLIRHSNLSDWCRERILLIDNIGMLTYLYRYGRAAYIGGGFGAGIHNTLEPIAYDLPVFFGPRFRKFEEARALVDRGGGFSIREAREMANVLESWTDEPAYRKASEAAKTYLLQNKGATLRIIHWLEKEGYLF